MKKSMLFGAFLSLLPAVASAQGFPTKTVRLTSNDSQGVPAIQVSQLTEDTFFIMDTTGQSFGGFYLPDCNTLATPRSFGATKVDGSSNPVQFFFTGPNGDIAGSWFINLTLKGENITLGCDKQSASWFVMSGEFQKGEYKVHRTPRSDTYPVYTLRESDRYANVRYVADTAPGKVVLSDLPWVKAGYAKTFTVRVQRTANSQFPVEVCAPAGRSLDNVFEGCITLTAPRELVDIDFDSAEFDITHHYPAGEIEAHPTAYPNLE